MIWQLFLLAVPDISGLEREPSSTREKKLDYPCCQHTGVDVGSLCVSGRNWKASCGKSMISLDLKGCYE